MPGAGFKKIARQWRRLQESVRNKPYDMVVDQQVSFRNMFLYACVGVYFALNSQKALRILALSSPALRTESTIHLMPSARMQSRV